MTALREARIILPILDNHGAPTTDAHAWLTEALIDTFGGATMLDCNGVWRGPDGKVHRDPGVAYDVAIPDDTRSAYMLRDIAAKACEMARQECVYVRWADHTVSMISQMVEA